MEEAEFIYQLLNTEVCKKFINSVIFLDSKRPVTISLLDRINFLEISKLANRENDYYQIFSKGKQLSLL
jgi:hypothetical protein